MNYFGLLNSGIESHIIKEQKQIIEKIKNVANISEKTAKRRLDSFKDILLAGSANPAFTDLCNKLEVPEELFSICRKMTHFVLSEKYITINNPRKTGTYQIECHYEVPLLFMPILISFIDAMWKKPKKNPVASFFEHMDIYLEEYSTKDITEKYSYRSTESLVGIYKDWATTYLGRFYFIHLEELLNECAESQYQRKHLLTATMQLTTMAAPPISICKIPSEQDMAELDRLLTEYRANLTAEKEKQGIDALCADEEAVYLESERACINDARKQFKKALKEPATEIKDFIAKNHKSDSLYEIAIRDLDCLAILEKQVSKSLADALIEIERTIHDYYMNLEQPEKYADGPLQSLYDSNKLILNQENNKHKMDTLSGIFRKALDETSRNIKVFFKDVREASGSNPSRFGDKRTEYRFKKIWIADKIKQIWDETIKNIKKENLPEVYPSFYHPITSYINQIGYPYGTDIPLPGDSTQSAEGTSAENRMD